MPLKDVLNSTLRRTTGYNLTRETPEERRAAIDAAASRASDQAARKATREERAQGKRRLEEYKAEVQRERDAEKERQAKRPQTSNLRAHLDEFTRSTIHRVKPWTMTGAPKLESLVEAVRHIERHHIPGQIVECGVWRGGSMQAIALTLMEQGNTERDLHLYDTFTGMSEPTEEDFSVRNGEKRTASALLATHDKDARVWAVAGIDVVREGMETTGYPTERIHYHPGMVEETIPSEAPEQIALLRLDTDWYASTRHELEHLWDRLSPGGMLLIDDYGDWEGARKAVDEWLEKTGLVLYLAPMGPGRVAMKPPLS